MDAKLKAQWLTALRSGKYAQGVGALRSRDDEYCCLGVLCDIIDPTGWKLGTWTAPKEMVSGDQSRNIYSGHLLPEAVANSVLGKSHAEADNQNGVLDFSSAGSEGFEALTSLNDNGFTFSQIADIIENKF